MSAAVRIVHVANFYGPHSGGLRTTMHALGREYRARGHEVTLVVPGSRVTDEETPYGRRVTLPAPVVPGSGGYRVLTDVDRVRRVLAGLDPAVLEVSDRTTLAGLGTWARRRGVPCVALAHERVDRVLGEHTRTPLRWEGVADLLNRRLVAGFDAVVVTTPFAGDELRRIGAAPHTVPLGVDLAAFRPRRDHAVRARLAGDHPVLLAHVGRLSTEKRPGTSLDVLRHVRALGVDARLVVAGTGPREASLRRRSRGLPVTFLGHLGTRREVADVLAAADVALAPGPHETFGLAALEALACGTPAVVSSCSALPHVVSDAGLAAPDAAGMAEAVVELLQRPEELRRDAARARAEQFPWSASADRMLELHRGLLADGPARDRTPRPTAA